MSVKACIIYMYTYIYVKQKGKAQFDLFGDCYNIFPVNNQTNKRALI